MSWQISVYLLAVCNIITRESMALTPKEIQEFRNYLEETSNIKKHVKGVDVSDDNEAWLNSGKFEGDILLNDIQREEIAATVGKSHRAVITNLTYLWSNKTVPYMINKSQYSEAQMKAIMDAMDYISNKTCIIFRQVHPNDVVDGVIIDGSNKGCSSYVGKQGGKQIVNLDKRHTPGKGCFRQGSIQHELLHALGFYHTQSRTDRDKYVKILWNNIKPDKKKNFYKYDVISTFDTRGGRDLINYDYASIMHYNLKAFSVRNGQNTMKPLQATTADIGQRNNLSQGDIDKLNILYCT